MRTNIFNAFADLPEEFREDFEILWSLPKDQRLALVPYISEFSKAETTRDIKKTMDKAISEISGDATQLLRVLKLLQFISAQWDPINDTPENFLRDLNELSLIPREKEEETTDFLLDFSSELQRDNRRRLQKMHANALLPSFISVSTLVDFRAVMERPFGAGLDDRIENYEPRCIDFAPVILIGLRCDAGDPAEFRFQCEPEDLKILIEQLQATLKDLESAKSSFPGGIR